MNLEITKSEKCIVLKPLKQNIDVTTSSAFKGRIIDLINQGNTFFLLNLSQVEFVDSSGLGVLISILKMTKKNSGEMVLCELNHPVSNLFNLTRMNSVFKIYANEKEGLNALAKLNR